MATIQTQFPNSSVRARTSSTRCKDIGTATVAGSLGHSGFRNPHMLGPVTQNQGKSIVGHARSTLQFLPQRPDLVQRGRVCRSGKAAASPRASTRSRKVTWSSVDARAT